MKVDGRCAVVIGGGSGVGRGVALGLADAGARIVVADIEPDSAHGVAEEMHSLEEARVLRDGDYGANDLVLGGNHAFCTTRMHGNPERGVVDERGRCHDHDGLHIADSGVFPRCPSVNPMWTVMALAHRTAHAIAEEG